jgi:hypothetical protein
MLRIARRTMLRIARRTMLRVQDPKTYAVADACRDAITTPASTSR